MNILTNIQSAAVTLAAAVLIGALIGYLIGRRSRKNDWADGFDDGWQGAAHHFLKPKPRSPSYDAYEAALDAGEITTNDLPDHVLYGIEPYDLPEGW